MDVTQQDGGATERLVRVERWLDVAPRSQQAIVDQVYGLRSWSGFATDLRAVLAELSRLREENQRLRHDLDVEQEANAQLAEERDSVAAERDAALGRRASPMSP